MLQILEVVLPVFLVIGAGYAAVRSGRFSSEGVDGLLSFTVGFAVPTFLFLKMYQLPLGSAFDWGAIVSFYAGAFSGFALGVLFARMIGRTPGEAVAIGFGAFFSNTVLIGVPVMTRAYGEGALEPMFGIIAFHAPTLYTVGMIAMEMSRRGGEGALAALKRAGASLMRNGLMIGILSGLALNLSGVALPEFAIDATELLASAALPAALFGIGGALTRYHLRDEIGPALAVSVLSLIAHPLIAYIGAAHIFELDPELVRAAVVTAAMPAGMNVYVFAAMYRRAEGVAAGAVLLSTALAVITVSGWLALLGGVGGG